MEQVRSFIAIELPDELKTGLSQLQSQLGLGEQPWIKQVDTNSIHLTLKFLGNVSITRISEITKATEEAAQIVSPFQLESKGLGAFPSLNRIQVVWVGIGGEIDKLAKLQQCIEFNLGTLGFAVEKRSFTPHLTLARLRAWAPTSERQRLGQLISVTKFDMTYTINVDSISLMKSQLTRGGAVYSRISSIKLNMRG